jgi:ribonucleoside-diphosphate reductase alpha chain
MHRFSNTGREVGQGGRRAAQMITNSIHYPDIEDFITIKADDTSVTGANISIRLSNEFLNAVEAKEDYELRWPVDSKKPTVSRMTDADTMWRKVIHNAWKRAEPGILFWDMILRECPANYYEEFLTISTNPCGEITLSAYDSCRLLAMNLWGYIRKPFTKEAYFDYKSFYEDAKIAQRLMDDLIDLELECIDKILAKINEDPEDDEVKFTERNLWLKIKEACINGRRTGLGITALGDVLAGLNIKYGSDESIDVTERVYKTLKFAAYESSIEMAEELGPFPVWDWNLEKECPFLQRIGNERIELNDGSIIYGADLLHRMSKNGRRNIALLTTAPTGTLSMLCEIGWEEFIYNNTTSGIEPAFLLWYERLKKGNPGDSGFRSDFIDKSGDHWMKFKVYHSGYKLWMDVTGETDETKSPYYGACADDLKWTQRVKLQAAAQRHVDHSISSTVNIPEDITEEEVSKIYTTAWKSGCKGITVYRKNCRSGVLIDPNSKNETKVADNNAEKRQEVLPCDIFNVKIKGERYFTLVGLQNGPYEIFVGKLDFDLEGNDKGSLKKLARGKYQLLDETGKILCPNITDYLTDEEQVLTRLISTSLRHRTPIEFILHQIEKTTGELQSPAKVLGRVLKKYIKDGSKVTGESCPNCQAELVRKEGCVCCLGCGYSKCN